MTEARRCEISLLNDRKLEILVQPKLLAGDLLDMAASHFGLREKEYFGLWFADNMNQRRWLRNEKKVLDHGFSKTTTTITLIFGIRLYVQSITHLKEATTIELFFLQASRLVYKDELQCDNKTAFLLAAYVMQVTNGDYVSESITRDDMKNLRLLPTRLTTNGDDLDDECVEKVAFHYKRMNGLPRGDAIVNFLSIVERLPTYGVHFFDVKDKNETSWRLGISHRGIGQYDTEDSVTARKIYMWSRMENLFYRDKKFSIEIRDLTRAGSNQSMNSISKYATLRSRQSQATADTWYLSTTVDAREIWALSVGYHQLFVNNKDVQRFQAIKTLKDIAKELTKSSSSLAPSVDSEFTGSTCSSDAFWHDQEDTEGMYQDFVTALSSKKEMLERRLHERENELKELTRQENELTSDFQKRNGPGADSSVGATFRFSDSVLNTSGSNEELEKLTRDYEIQSQITAAAKRLSLDPKAKRRVRKDRRILYEKASTKLKELEKKMKEANANQMTPTSQSPKSYEDSYSERDDISESSNCKTPTQQDEFDTNSFTYPDREPHQLGRRTMSLQSGGVEGDYYNTLKANLRNNRKTSAEMSPSSRRMIPNRYVIGDFDSSGIYSGLRNTRKNTLVDQYRNINGSSSLTQIPKLSQQFSNMTSASCDELETNSGQNEFDGTDYSNYITQKTEELRTRIQNLNNGPVEENTFHSPRPVQSQASGFGGSLLAGAAWSQLSQPSMVRLAPDIVSPYETVEMSRDDELYYDVDESYLGESIMEDDQEREETLV